MKICFDMDGTIANLYGVENWLEYLIAEDVKPYAEAKVMLNMNSLARLLNNLQKKGNEIYEIKYGKGYEKKYDKNWNIKYEGESINGEANGKEKLYYENGKVQFEG